MPVKTAEITAFGETKSRAAWSRDARCVVSLPTLRTRLVQYGWDPERAMSTPVVDPHQCHAKLTPVQVTSMRKRMAAGEQPSVLGPEFGVTTQHVQEIAAGHKWRCAGA